MFELALALGCTTREIERLPASEVEGWRAFYALQPFGPWRDNFHAAQIAYILAAANRNPKRPAPKIDEFMYRDPVARIKDNDTATILFFDSKAT